MSERIEPTFARLAGPTRELSPIDSIEGTWSGYDWSVFGVFEIRGRLFYGSDSGCSCYGPWENTDEGDLSPIDTYESFNAALNTWLADGNESSLDSPEEAQNLRKRMAERYA